MSLSCGCAEHDGYGWWYEAPVKYTQFPAQRRKRCLSCKTLINHGDTIAEFTRFRQPNGDIEERIYGSNDVPLASQFMCETCADIFFSIEELGYCVSLPADMREDARQAADMIAYSRETRPLIKTG